MDEEVDNVLPIEVGLAKELIKLEDDVDALVVIDESNLMVVVVTDKSPGDLEFEVVIVVTVKC